MRVFVYWNLHRKCWSVKDKRTGVVRAHASVVSLVDCVFKVHESGRQRVLRERRKNVHAGVEGTLVGCVVAGIHADPVIHDGMIAVGYNPYHGDTFTERETDKRLPVKSAEHVVMGNGTVHAAGVL